MILLSIALMTAALKLLKYSLKIALPIIGTLVALPYLLVFRR